MCSSSSGHVSRGECNSYTCTEYRPSSGVKQDVPVDKAKYDTHGEAKPKPNHYPRRSCFDVFQTVLRVVRVRRLRIFPAPAERAPLDDAKDARWCDFAPPRLPRARTHKSPQLDARGVQKPAQRVEESL